MTLRTVPFNFIPGFRSFPKRRSKWSSKAVFVSGVWYRSCGGYDLNRERISLGLKQTTEDPWRALVKKYPVGAIVEGTVTKLVPFGAFVDLGEGIEGLVHISEMANKHVDQPSQVTHVGDKVQVKVMEIDLDRRRISLSMKSAAETLGVEIEVTPLPSEKKDEETDAE